MPTDDAKPTCFIAMPITTHADEAARYGGDVDHWDHVMETIFVPAAEAAGFDVIRPAAVGSHMIHGQIIRHLSQADMVLCDLSGHNPNVFFELGVRTSLNLPIALVRDEHTSIPFDTSGLNTHQYASSLNAWDTSGEVKSLTEHLAASVESCDGKNPMWKHFGLTIAATGPSDAVSSADARMELMFEGVQEMRRDLMKMQEMVGYNKLDSGRTRPGSMSHARAVGEDIGPGLNASLVRVSRLRNRDLRLTFEKVGEALPLSLLGPTASALFSESGLQVEKLTDAVDGMLDIDVRPAT